ncbi:MAG: spermidine/putrescine ABC transporter substrate-binding protein [Spirochaetae bacterium HGW-Spirochaetae-7]|jgi:spermidine/putrescine transport system substrate-binding protein|nr:MAG: spermidine/putrescine ABC transporter substrate-binding protein [Spirochaetae bacterium HGW-Spirochaetae-7]
MKKRTILLALAALALAVMTSCGGGQKLYLFNWIYYIPDDVITDFTKETGIKVVVDSYASNEEMYNKIVAGGAGGAGYDLVVPSGDYVSIMIAEGLLEPIDKSKLKNFGNIDPAAIARIGFDVGNTHSVPYMMGAAGVAVNRTKVSGYEHSWNIFEKADIAGRMTMLDDMREVLGAALKYLGYSVNDPDPAHLEEARLVVERWKPNLVKFDAEAFAKSFASGEFWVVQGYAENVFLEYPEDKRGDVDFFFPKEGTPMYMDNLCILKGAKHAEQAYKFIDWILRPEIAARIADYLMIPSPNVPARALMKVAPNYRFEDLANSEFKEDLGQETLKLYNDVWRRIRVGN